MLVTVLTLVALSFLLVAVGVGRFIYSFTLSNSSRTHNDMKTKALDVFMYLGIGISLVLSVTNFLQVVFSAIDRKFFDVLSYSYTDVTSSDVRFAIASLVVMFPVYLLLSWYTSRDIKKFIYKQDMWARKVLIYCALFVTILSLIGTLVAVVYTYLGGELTVKFGLKAVSVFLVAFALFGYYFYSLRRDYSKKTFIPLMLGLIASAVVVASVVWSIMVIGTPSEMRARKFDSTRLSDISRIQQEVLNHFQTTEKLPGSLSELENAFGGYMVPTDPLTKEVYEYKVVSQPTFKMNYVTNKKEMVENGVFELCATFSTVREVNARGQQVYETKPIATDMVGLSVSDSYYSATNYYYEGDQSPFWNHKAERTCYKRVINKTMYYPR